MPLRSRIPKAWRAKADKHQKELRTLDPDKRSAYIRKRILWTKLRPLLRALSHGKCWYCESRDIRSHSRVDHFRPKGRLAAVEPPHFGYWWLAYRWTNYRLSCSFCNERARGPHTIGGKHNYFPLAEESRRCRLEKSSLAKETPLLIDPLSASDVHLIYVTAEGRAAPLVDDIADLRNRRAQSSIDLYHLNEDQVVNLRAVVQKQVLDFVRLGDQIAETTSGEATANLSLVKQSLEKFLSSDACYVTMTRQLVRSIRGRGASWLDDVKELEVPIRFPA